MLFHITEVVHILEKSNLDTLSWKVSYSGAFYILRQLEIESEGIVMCNLCLMWKSLQKIIKGRDWVVH